MSMNHYKEGMGLALPAILNPELAAGLALGLIGLGIVKLLSDSEDYEVEPPEKNRSKQAIKPLETVDSGASVNGATAAGFSASKQEVVTTPSLQIIPDVGQPPLSSDADEKELIRKAMSKLGKRSAVARARRKAEANALSLANEGA